MKVIAVALGVAAGLWSGSVVVGAIVGLIWLVMILEGENRCRR